MVSPTIPDGIPRPVGGDGFKLTAFLSSMGDAIQTALSKRGPVLVNNAAERDAIFPGTPPQGALVTRADVNWTERYYGAYNATSNPGGAAIAGWYPDFGKVPKMRLAKTDAQTINTGFADINWNNDTYKNAITHDPSTGAASAPVTIQVSGRYSFTIRVGLQSAEMMVVQLQRNGQDLGRFAVDNKGTTANFTKALMVGTETFQAGDVLRVRARTTASIALESSQCYWDLEYNGAPV